MIDTNVILFLVNVRNIYNILYIEKLLTFSIQSLYKG